MTYNFHINDFEGPLDLLLHLIKSAKMNIYEINISEIIDEYLSFLKKEEELNIDIASEYLVMASELIHLKSRLLANRHDEEESEDELAINSEEDLKNKLIEYEKYKQITDDLKVLEEKRSEIFTKLPESLQEYVEEPVLSGEIGLADLMQAFELFLKRQKHSKPLNTRITKRELSVEDRTRVIRSILKEKGKVNFLDLFEEITKEYVIVTFLSILEMSKNSEIALIQEDSFSPIIIERVD